MRNAAIWSLLFIVGIVLVVAGFEGRFGSLLAAIFAPSSLVDNTTDSSVNGTQGGPSTIIGPFVPPTVPATPGGTVIIPDVPALPALPGGIIL